MTVEPWRAGLRKMLLRISQILLGTSFKLVV